MTFAQYIKELGRGATGSADMSGSDAQWLYGAMLDGGVPDLELGAVVIALRMKGESAEEMSGFLRAVHERVNTLKVPGSRARPVVLPSYNGARKSANLTPLLALLLKRFGVPVLVHGLLEGYGRVTSGHIFREFGLQPSVTPGQAQKSLEENSLAFMPLSALVPGLANLLSLRGRMGVRNSAHSLVKMFDPFKGEGVVVGAATHPDFIDLMREVFTTEGARALLLRGTEGEPYANPRRRPRLEYIHDGACDMLFDAEHESVRALPNLPEVSDAVSTVRWMRQVLEGQIPLPLPIANQLACLLFASGYAQDFNQAKAIVAVEGNGGVLGSSGHFGQ